MGKTVVVTGAASGLGAEVARQFAAEGAALVLVDIAPEGARRLALSLNEAGKKAVVVEGDCSKAETARRAVDVALDGFGGVDVLVNNAGIDPWNARSITETSDEQWNAILAVNLSSAYLFCKEVIPKMTAVRTGAIVNVASIAGLNASSNEAAYGISKAAVIHLTKTIAKDYARLGIRSNSVCPGILEAIMTDRQRDMAPDMIEQRFRRASERIPQGRQGRYEEVARAVVFLSSERDASYINGANLVVDGGLSA